MRVIKEGDALKAIIRFECGYCGCVFECNTSEAEVTVEGRDATGRLHGISFECKCPTCKMYVTSK